jgi:hypothetical protein
MREKVNMSWSERIINLTDTGLYGCPHMRKKAGTDHIMPWALLMIFDNPRG